ncbi:RES domain-containing protein [Chryseobacterium soli]|uniref:RES domain-containing protein n=1 Tax=Chryseobacterium soli TaxID=445961 RepID=UPI00068AFD06|nr:RES domain-containing protein [Chryseobacterium soli]
MNYICHECLGEDFLNKFVLSNGESHECSYCENRNVCIPLDDIISKVEYVILNHYERTPETPDYWQQFSDQMWIRNGSIVEDILKDDFDINEYAAIEIAKILEDNYFDMELAKMSEECEFGPDTHYTKKRITDQRWLSEWEVFKKILKTESRFFSKKVNNILENIFNEIELMTTHDLQSVVTTIGPKDEIKSLYRSRTFFSSEKILDALVKPDKLLGPPPAPVASSGRMNAKGISVFYSSVTKDVAIAEVRPPVGSHVVVSEFEILKQLKLLNFNILTKVVENISVFHPEYKEKKEKAYFLANFCKLITQPVMPGDEELEYLPTQAISDFLTEKFDGIIFPSVQVNTVNNHNVVLFNNSCKVEEFNVCKNRILTASKDYFDDEEIETYHLINRPGIETRVNQEDDSRIPTLRLRVDSIEIHKIAGVQYTYTPQLFSFYKSEVPTKELYFRSRDKNSPDLLDE